MPALREAWGIGRVPWPTAPLSQGSPGLLFVPTAPLHQLVQTQPPREGAVTWRTYHTYIKAAGGLASNGFPFAFKSAPS